MPATTPISRRPAPVIDTVDVRRVVPADFVHAEAFLADLSEASRWSRFFGALPEMTPAWVERFMAVEPPGILLACEVNGRPVAGGRAVPTGRAGECEFALTVTDPWQGRGLGGVLLDALVDHAAAAGFTHMRGDILADNAPMIALAAGRGFALAPAPRDRSVLEASRRLQSSTTLDETDAMHDPIPRDGPTVDWPYPPTADAPANRTTGSGRVPDPRTRHEKTVMGMRPHEVHPSLVHYPLALVPAAVALDAIGRVTGNQPMMNIARVFMPVAAASGLLAAVSGFIAARRVRARGEAGHVLSTHRNLNVALVAVTTGMAVVRARQDHPSIGYLALGLAGVALMKYTAYLGGRMVYKHGVGVSSAGGVLEDRGHRRAQEHGRGRGLENDPATEAAVLERPRSGLQEAPATP